MSATSRPAHTRHPYRHLRLPARLLRCAGARRLGSCSCSRKAHGKTTPGSCSGSSGSLLSRPGSSTRPSLDETGSFPPSLIRLHRRISSKFVGANFGLVGTSSSSGSRSFTAATLGQDGDRIEVRSVSPPADLHDPRLLARPALFRRVFAYLIFVLPFAYLAYAARLAAAESAFSETDKKKSKPINRSRAEPTHRGREPHVSAAGVRGRRTAGRSEGSSSG